MACKPCEIDTARNRSGLVAVAEGPECHGTVDQPILASRDGTATSLQEPRHLVSRQGDQVTTIRYLPVEGTMMQLFEAPKCKNCEAPGSSGPPTPWC